LKLLTATEWAGVVFALSLIVHTVQGFELFEKLFQHQGNVQGNEKEDNMDSGEDDVSKSNNECENENMNENNPIDDGVQNRTAINPYDILYILEMLLSFHAWYKCGGPYKCANEVEQCKIHKALSKMLQTVKEKIPRNICNGWKLQKFHNILHFSRDLFMFGSPQNWDASPGEHNLIDFAKRPA